MRKKLSQLLVDAARQDPNIIVLSGDHGYSLFDELRKEFPKQFINCGVAEQNMIGVAAGLARQGFKPIVYGLASFVPIRVLEQIKLDVCFSNLPITFLGDGAGLVYSKLGASHHCAEDVATLGAMPNMSIYSPCDRFELEDAFIEALGIDGPAYIRLGKCDRPEVSGRILNNSRFWATHYGSNTGTALVSTGSMTAIATAAANKHHIDCYSVIRIKPIEPELIDRLSREYSTVIVIEEHSQYGGLFSSLAGQLIQKDEPVRPRVIPITLEDKFTDKCGDYQYALSEHKLDDASILSRIEEIVNFS